MIKKKPNDRILSLRLFVLQLIRYASYDVYYTRNVTHTLFAIDYNIADIQAIYFTHTHGYTARCFVSFFLFHSPHDSFVMTATVFSKIYTILNGSAW